MTHEQLVAYMVDAIKPLLAGHPPPVQGAVCAELTALWLAGHPQPMREALLALQTQTTRELTTLAAQQLGNEP